ncbi:hypothetical protein [Flavobacterium piscisymbiosum]|uniref:Outer membrane protein beta-barrel domain-containing protein n=1 Tax=Flavobacterium piscisymbiosum TaxID=2893753 RepID=A0ABS8M9C4_9FLAO|nr:hypothetical protein [Flavobacterium sp. F-30]MCC9061477.1 hypothetical protein [Flavobacterium sp. F-30]
MKKQNIEDIFSSMEDFSSVPPPELWGEIEKKLDKPKKKKRVILWWSAAACLLLGLLLPSVLHFNSTSGIKTIQIDSQQNNSVVLDEKKNDTNTNRTISTEENKSGKAVTEKESDIINDVSSIKNKANQPENSQKNKNQKTAVAHTESKKSNSGDLNSNTEKPNNNNNNNNNTAVAEKTFVTDHKNGFNSDSQHQVANADKNVSNQAIQEKTTVSGKIGLFNPNSKIQPLTDKKFSNKTLAEKALATSKTNGFNSASKNQIANADKKASNKILAEKTFSAGKVNPFNPSSKNQLSKSIFEDKYTSNNNVALNSSFLNENKKDLNGIKSNEQTGNLISEKQLAGNQKSNSKFNDVLSRKDSVQLAELQNLEKGIITPEEKKEKESKKLNDAEKWAVEVFAGVASSENYKNEKTLGNTNDSRQSNSYGVKTKYKINKKWAVASGLKINELGQSVANVSYLSAKNNAFFSSSDYFNQSASAALSAPITANDNYVFVPNTTSDAFKQNNIENNNLKNGNLDQNLRYLEMPLEVSYVVFSLNRASINLNTGGFVGKLISNNVALDGNSIGQNVNANDYVYGSTLSSTLQYRVYKKTNIFVEPAMNYYINPLSNQSFNQFQWGLNFGLNVSF